MSDMISIQPTAEQRVPFARWAVAQTPKVRTVSPSVFAVPTGLFTAVPEAVLIGALVDGHRYVSPDEDAELLGVATPEGLTPPVQEAVPGEALPEVPDEAYGPDSTPLPAPEPDDEPRAETDGVFPCSGCDREFTTERGRNLHRRQAHPED